MEWVKSNFCERYWTRYGNTDNQISGKSNIARQREYRNGINWILTSWFNRYVLHWMCGTQYGFPDPRCLLLIEVMSAHFQTRRVTHLTCIIARVEWIFGERIFVQSLGWDLGHQETFQNGPENRIHIWEVNLMVWKSSGHFRYCIEKLLEGTREGLTWLGGTTWAHAGPM
jgi:hypothetical protein